MRSRHALLALTTALLLGGAAPALAGPGGTPDVEAHLERATPNLPDDKPGPPTEIVYEVIGDPPAYFDPDGRICVRLYWYVMTDPHDGDEIAFHSCPLILVKSG